MTTTRTQITTVRIQEAIGRNVDRWYDDRITRKQFNRNQNRLWRLAEGSGVNEALARMIGPAITASRGIGN